MSVNKEFKWGKFCKDIEWLKKQMSNNNKNQYPSMGFLQETPFTCKDTQAESEEMWKRDFHASGNQKKIGIAILTSDKRDIKAKAVNERPTKVLCNDQEVSPTKG